MFVRTSELLFCCALVAVSSGVPARAGAVYNITELHAATAYSPDTSDLATLVGPEVGHVAEDGLTAAMPDSGDLLPPPDALTALQPDAPGDTDDAFPVEPFLPDDTGVFYTTGFTFDHAWVYTPDGQTVRFSCDERAGVPSVALCSLSTGRAGETASANQQGFGCALFGQEGLGPEYRCADPMRQNSMLQNSMLQFRRIVKP